MKPCSFLEGVARAYLSRYDDLSEFCFVFPNKRSGTFFIKALTENLDGHVMIAPEVLSVDDFMGRVSGLEIGSRIDLLFRLYNVYRALTGKGKLLKGNRDLLDFDRFGPWGETVLSDFSEIDKYDADASALLRNVRDLRDIEANFLTPEQCDALERLLGRRPAMSDVEGFWKTVLPREGHENEDPTRLKERFVELWTLLPELYEGLHADLVAASLATPGGAYRSAMHRVLRSGAEAVPWRKVVVVGFNLLSTSEFRMFGEMRDILCGDSEPLADFLWDATGPVLAGEGAVNVAAAQMRRYMRLFPMPEWATPYIDMARKDTLPESLTVAAAPSNAAQVKIAAMRVGDWLEQIGPDKIADARAAVVIPDENLLLPLVHSLPDELESINLTMGYSMRFTSVASFMFHLRRLHARIRKADGEPAFYHEDLKLFLSHPLVQVVAGTGVANKIRAEIVGAHMLVIPLSWIARQSQSLAALVTPLPASTPVADTIMHIGGVLDIVDKALAREEMSDSRPQVVNSKIERMLVTHYRQALARLLGSVEEHGIEMRPASVFHLVERLLAGETVTFEGEPLHGLQVMGLLETRALDFEHIVVLSMNDRIMPRKSGGRTFLPAALRSGYGLPGPNRAEELYAYYFYRMISRADDVTLVYDARAGEGMRSGGKSRFLMQLELLHARGSIKEKVYSFALGNRQPVATDIAKKGHVLERLGEFMRREGGLNLSASALMNYCRCQVLFYYKNVVGIKDETEASDHLDPITQGNIVHDVLLRLYVPHKEMRGKYLDKRISIGREYLQSLLDDGARVADEVRRAANRLHYHLPEDDERPLCGSVAMTAPYLEEMVRNVIRRDLELAPFQIVGCEITGCTRMKMGEAPEVNMRFAFDRVDIVNGRMRIVDYKTGSSHLEARDMDDVFAGGQKGKYILQLLIYARLLEQVAPPSDKKAASEAAVMVYDVNGRDETLEVRPRIGGCEVCSHAEVGEAFAGGLERLVSEIFDPSVPFRPAADESSCAFCTLKYLCGKE